MQHTRLKSAKENLNKKIRKQQGKKLGKKSLSVKNSDVIGLKKNQQTTDTASQSIKPQGTQGESTQTSYKKIKACVTSKSDTKLDSVLPTTKNNSGRLWTKRKKHTRKAGDSKRKSSPTAAKPALAAVTDGVEVDTNWKALSKKLGKTSSWKKGAKKEDKTVTATPDPSSESSNSKEIWFDDVDEFLLGRSEDLEFGEAEHTGSSAIQTETGSRNELEKKLVKDTGHKGLTKCVAMDCEMVGVGPGGVESALARVSIVNQFGHCLYDTFVKPKEEVTDYRTWVSGVRPIHLTDAPELEEVQKEVYKILKGRILVGHAISNDEQALFLSHPKRNVRDTQTYKGYRLLTNSNRPGLKSLAKKALGVDIQSGEHSSIQDAQATMRLYTLVRQKWEQELRGKRKLRQLQTKLLAKKVKK